MADQLEKIVDVTITRQTTVPSMKSFNGHLIVDDFNPVGITPIFDKNHRVYIFGGIDEVQEAGFPTNGYIYRAAQKQFSQNPHIKEIYIGWKIPSGLANGIAKFSGEFVTGNKFTMSIGGTALDEIAFDDYETMEGVLEALIEQINDSTDTSFARVTADGFTVEGADLTITMAISGGVSRPTFTYTHTAIEADSTWADALTAIKAQNNDWYALSVSTRNMANQQVVAQWVEANEKLCILASGDDLLINEETGDIASWAKLNALDRTAIFYHPASKLASSESDVLPADDNIPESAYFGKMLTKHPGSATWKFKTLQAVQVYELPQYKVSNIEKKNATWYMPVADVNMTSDGKVASGEYIDVIHGLDWMKALIQNYVFTPMIQLDKIPFTDEGVQIIVGQLKKALDQGVKYSLFASYEISYPAVADIPALDKGNRHLPDVNFTAVLAGAVHRTTINGTVTL